LGYPGLQLPSRNTKPVRHETSPHKHDYNRYHDYNRGLDVSSYYLVTMGSYTDEASGEVETPVGDAASIDRPLGHWGWGARRDSTYHCHVRCSAAHVEGVTKLKPRAVCPGCFNVCSSASSSRRQLSSSLRSTLPGPGSARGCQTEALALGGVPPRLIPRGTD